MADKLGFDMGVQPVFKPSSVEDAFSGVQKAQCGAIYAEASDLKNLTSAMTSANIPFGYSSVWISPRAVEDAASALAQKHQRAEGSQADEVRPSAKKQLEDATLFISRYPNPNDPKLLDYIGLSNALEVGDRSG